MAISVVQSTGAQTASSVASMTLTLNGVAAGNTIFVVVAEYRSGGTTSTQYVSDGEGRYSRDAIKIGGTTGAGDGLMTLCIHRLTGVSSGTHTITVTASTATSNLTAIAFEARSSFTANRIYKEWDRRSSGTGTSAATGSTPVTSQQASFSIAAVVSASTQASIAVSTSPIAWSQLVEQLSLTAAAAAEFDTVSATTSGVVSASWTLGTSAEWVAVCATYGEVLT